MNPPHYYRYDNLLFPGSFPVLDRWALLFNVTGLSEPVSIYYDSTGFYGSGIGYEEAVYVGSGGNNAPDSAFEVYRITSLTLQAQSVALLDPALTLFLPTTSTITSDLNTLASGGRDVSAIAADGVAQLLVRVNGLGLGDQINLSIVDETGQLVSNGEDGTLSNLIAGTAGSGIVSPVPQAVNGQYDAFVLYQSPIDFVRASALGVGDTSKASRQLTIQVTDSNNIALASVPFQLLRPPVFFVHGLWGDPSTWNEFDTFLRNSINGLNTYRADFAKNNGDSVSFNTPNVLVQAYNALDAFRATKNAAAAQLDFIVHSMGGLISDTMPTLSLFRTPSNYGQGIIHKLITFDTPYQGSPFATGLDQSTLACRLILRGLGAKVGGAVRDLVPGSAFGQSFNPAPPGYSKHAIASYVISTQAQAAAQAVNSLFVITLGRVPLADACFSVFVNPSDIAPPLFSFTDYFFTQSDPYNGANDLIVSERSQLGPYLPGTTADTTLGLAHSHIPVPFLAHTPFPGSLDSGVGIPPNPEVAVTLLNRPAKDNRFVQ
jgi:pimeloyl-ACP methyl ester carboxylesterase